MIYLLYILSFLVCFWFMPIILLIGRAIMDLVYLCGCNPNSCSSINGELPQSWLDQTHDEIRRMTLSCCKEALKHHTKHNTTNICGIPPQKTIETAKPANIKNIFYSTFFEDYLAMHEASVIVDYPKERDDICDGKCVSYLRVGDDVIFTIHYYQDSTGAWLLRKV